MAGDANKSWCGGQLLPSSVASANAPACVSLISIEPIVEYGYLHPSNKGLFLLVF